MKDRWRETIGGIKAHSTGGVESDGMWWSDGHSLVLDCMGFCCCGDPEAVTGYVSRKLKEIRDRSFHPDGYTAENYFFWYWAEAAGLTEHGSCVPGWLTKDGEALIDAIDALPEGGEDA